MMRNIKNNNIKEPYLSAYRKESRGKWYYEEYFRISYLENRKAYNQKPGRSKKLEI